MNNQKLGYQQLTQAEKEVYERIEQALLQEATTFDGRGFSPDVNVMDVLQVVLGDHPTVVYFDKTKVRVMSSIFGKEYQLTGLADPAKRKRMTAQLKQAAEQAIEEIRLLNPLTDYDRLMCIYEYIQDHVVYDDEELAAFCRGQSRNQNAHNAYGALVEGKAVCDGISSAFCLLAQKMGFSCMLVPGRATFRTNGLSEHAWNLILVGGKYYHLDLTWDLNTKCQTGEYHYSYFCCNDDDISTDHAWEVRLTPPCESRAMSYFVRNDCYVESIGDLERIFWRFAKSKQNVVRVKLSHGLPIPAPEDQFLGNKLAQIAGKAGRRSRIQIVMNPSPRCFYGKFCK